MTDDDHMEIDWDYPLYIIGTANGVAAVDYKDSACCLVYRQKELAELYVEQAKEHGDDCYLVPVTNEQEFHDGLSSLKTQNVDHVIWDPTYFPSVCKVTPIDDIVYGQSSELCDMDEGPSQDEP